MILGIGSAHIDILATVTGDPKVKDRIGKVSMDIGGTGGNVAVNCASLGLTTRFMTALNGSAHSRIIHEHLEKAGVEMYVFEDKSLPMAAFVAQINPEGEMDSAISCMPVEIVDFPDQLLREAMDGISAIFMDCNLSISTMQKIVDMAAALELPIFLAGVSEEKSLRAHTLVRSGRKVSALFINRREAEYLKKHIGHQPQNSKTMEDMALADILQCQLVITEGADGALLVTSDTIGRVYANTVEKARSLLCAGDAFMAGTLFYWCTQGCTLLNALQHAAGTAASVVVRDNCSLAESKAIDRAIDFFHDEARKDGLTQILNRASTVHFGEKALLKCIKQKKPFAAIILDIDHFKNINDTWGHPEGDKVIKNVARIVQDNMRESDICGRWGGEEFVCLLPGANDEVALRVAERIRTTIQTTLQTPREITVSIGIALAHEMDLSETIGMADGALYDSKRNGRNRVTLRG